MDDGGSPEQQPRRRRRRRGRKPQVRIVTDDRSENEGSTPHIRANVRQQRASPVRLPKLKPHYAPPSASNSIRKPATLRSRTSTVAAISREDAPALNFPSVQHFPQSSNSQHTAFREPSASRLRFDQRIGSAAELDASRLHLDPSSSAAAAAAGYSDSSIIRPSSARLRQQSVVSRRTLRSVRTEGSFFSNNFSVDNEPRTDPTVQPGDISKFGRIRQRVHMIVSTTLFSNFIMATIIFNTIVLIAATSQTFRDKGDLFFQVMDYAFLVVFLSEALMKMMAFGPRTYFSNSWNVLDFVIVIFGLVEFITMDLLSLETSVAAFKNVTVFRVLRIFRVVRAIRAIRVLRTIRVFRSLQVLVTTTLRSIASLGAITVVLSLFVYMFAVMGRMVFAKYDRPRWGTLWEAIFSVFQLLTLDDWFDFYEDVRQKNDVRGDAYMLIYLIVIFLILYLVFMNLFIAVLVDNFQVAMDEMRQTTKQDELEEKENQLLKQPLLVTSGEAGIETEQDSDDTRYIQQITEADRMDVDRLYADCCEEEKENLVDYFTMLQSLEYHSFKFDERVANHESFDENAKVAKLWRAGIKGLLRGLLFARAQDIVRVPKPPPRKFLVLLNPSSGACKANQLFHQRVLPMFAEAEVEWKLIVTKQAGHAKEMARSATDLWRYSAVVIVSGDGLLFEFVNGLMLRRDWRDAVHIPLAILPAGSGNALCCSICYTAGENYFEKFLLHSTFLLLKSVRAQPMDLVAIQTGSGKRFFSFLSVTYGLIADIDLESERFRKLGEARFAIGALNRILNLRLYRLRVSFLPVEPYTPPDEFRAPKPDGVNEPIDEQTTKHSRAVRSKTMPDINRFSASDTSADGDPSDLAAHANQTDETNKVDADGKPACSPDDLVPYHPDTGLAPDQFRLADTDASQQDVDVFANGNGETPCGEEEPVVDGTGDAPGGDTGREEAGDGSGGGHFVLTADDEEYFGPETPLLNPIGLPVPDSWVTIEGDFITVCAFYQKLIGSEFLAAPTSTYGDGDIYLLLARAGIPRPKLLQLFASTRDASHLLSPHIEQIRCRAFRMELIGETLGNLAVDGELVEPTALQGQVVGSLARLLAPPPPPPPPAAQRPVTSAADERRKTFTHAASVDDRVVTLQPTVASCSAADTDQSTHARSTVEPALSDGLQEDGADSRKSGDIPEMVSNLD